MSRGVFIGPKLPFRIRQRQGSARTLNSFQEHALAIATARGPGSGANKVMSENYVALPQVVASADENPSLSCVIWQTEMHIWLLKEVGVPDDNRSKKRLSSHF